LKNKYRLEKVDPALFTDEHWKRYYDFRVKSFAAIDKPIPFDSWQKLKELNLESINEGQEIFQVWKNEKANGIFYFSIEFQDNIDKRFTYLNNYLNDKFLESNLIELVFKKFLDYDQNSTALAVHSKEGSNDYVKDKFGAQIGSTTECYELEVSEANLDLIDTWLSNSIAKFPNFRIEFYKELPDELLEEFAAVFTQLLKDMPANSELGEMKVTAESTRSLQEAWKIRNHCAYRYFIFNEQNEIIAKTNVSINLKQPQKMHQFMTGVKKEYRGQGLSKWLKAAMFKKLLADFPDLEKIETETHPDNHPSRELSKQMGYKRTGSEKEFLIDRASIVRYLKNDTIQ